MEMAEKAERTEQGYIGTALVTLVMVPFA